MPWDVLHVVELRNEAREKEGDEIGAAVLCGDEQKRLAGEDGNGGGGEEALQKELDGIELRKKRRRRRQEKRGNGEVRTIGEPERLE